MVVKGFSFDELRREKMISWRRKSIFSVCLSFNLMYCMFRKLVVGFESFVRVRIDGEYSYLKMISVLSR